MQTSTGTDPSTVDEGSSGVAVLDRAFAILNAFEPGDNRLSLAELSRRTNLYKSTLLRLLGALEHGGFIRRLDDGQYAIGPQPLRLAALYQRSFEVGPVIEPILQRLSRELGETASLYVRQGDQRLVLFRVEPARAVRVSIRIGEEFPINKGESGKVLLAFSDVDDPRGHTIRERLWAVSHGERDPETASVSVPVFGATGQLIGTLALSGPKARFRHGVGLHRGVDGAARGRETGNRRARRRRGALRGEYCGDEAGGVYGCAVARCRAR
ncbi:MAG: Transcriptional regulator, IclR family [uncultured Paraburkholderia sp.]|nr:MAG: Transcriptional regulator, IclR family [uncultured Paraburkholderia sp.]